MRTYIDSFIKCPFFRSADKGLLCCEGFVDNTCMTTKFSDTAAAMQHISDNCCEHDGGRCPLAINLFEKYRAREEKRIREEREWYEKSMRLKRHHYFCYPTEAAAQKENRQP